MVEAVAVGVVRDRKPPAKLLRPAIENGLSLVVRNLVSLCSPARGRLCRGSLCVLWEFFLILFGSKQWLPLSSSACSQVVSH